MGNQLYQGVKIPPPPTLLAESEQERQWFDSITDELNSLSQILYDVRDFGAKGDGVNDDTEAIRRTIEATSKTPLSTSGIVYFSAGTYLISSTITVNYDTLHFMGASHAGTTLEPTMTDGTYTLAFVPPANNDRHRGLNISNLRIHAQDRNAAGIHMESVGIGRIVNLEIRSTQSVALDLLETWDTHFTNLLIRSSGTSGDNVPATRMRTTADDGCNRVTFVSGHWESNQGSDIYLDDETGSRSHALCQWINCKFHGIGGLSNASQPTNSAVRLRGNRHSILNGYFTLSNDYMIKVDADRCDIIGNVVNSGSLGFSRISGDFNRILATNQQNLSTPFVEILSGDDNIVDLSLGQANRSALSDSGTNTFASEFTNSLFSASGYADVSVETTTKPDKRQKIKATNPEPGDVWLSLLPGDGSNNAEIHFHETDFTTGNIRGRVRYEVDNEKMEFWTANTERGSWDSIGRFNITNPTVPGSGTAAGNTGDIAWDSDFVYVCTSTDSWRRATLNTF